MDKYKGVPQEECNSFVGCTFFVHFVHWDEANLDHIAEHGVSRSEAEEVVTSNPLDLGCEVRSGETRLCQAGETSAGRILAVITTFRNRRTRVVTAYPASRSLRATYLEHKESKRDGILPEFKSEAEEAKWWFDHQDELDEDFTQAAAEGRLGHGTAARLGDIPTATVCLDPEDVALASEQASQRGVKYHTYLKMLVHEALLKAKT